MFAIEIMVLLAAAGPAVLIREGALVELLPRVMRYMIETLVWVSAPAVWFFFLGEHELPILARSTLINERG
jgi:hypothetical protein